MQTRAARTTAALTALLAALAAALLTPAPAVAASSSRTFRPAVTAASLTEVTGFGSNPGALRMFRHDPPDLPANAPVVVALHGCGQDAGYAVDSGWTALADRLRFSVVVPQQSTANNLSKCFDWFQAGDVARGAGEAASIAQMVDRQLADVRGDASRVYVTGLSAGGGMTAVMMAAYPEKFAAGGIVAGLPYGCSDAAGGPYPCMYGWANQTPAQWGDRVRRARPGYLGPWPALTAFQGSADGTVKPSNMTDLVGQWTDVQGADQSADVSDTVAGYPHRIYRDPSGRAVAETYSVTGMGHGQPVDPAAGCGSAAPYILDVHLCAAGRLSDTWGLGPG
ncbi:extracellular catalytic domain type 1 short-chain-length polyhydroxyalkanoate depolymerase [Streptomyces collinus]